MKSFIVDSFTNEAFKGNPAAVCFPEQVLSEWQMLKIAAEFGFSETAFVQETERAEACTIRFFSPKKEIPLCGHATLAAAKVLFNSTTENEVSFTTVQNIELLVKRRGEDLEMSFPVYDTVAATVPDALLQALGIDEINNTAYSPNNKIILLEISDAELLKKLDPDYIALVKSYSGINGVLVTAKSADDYDYHYRYFWPWAGTNEDPVTGGVQTFLAKYWAERLGKNDMKAFQSSARTGYMHVSLHPEKVLITSRAVIVFEGNLLAF